MRTVLIDGDIWAYRACLRNEYEIDWGDDMWTLWGEFPKAQADFDNEVEYIREQLEADKVVLAISDTDNFRKRVLPSYKSNRKGKRKPVCYKPLREYIHEKYVTFQRPSLEGDDVLGILLTSSKIIEGEKILVSVDKDMKTLPGLHVNHTEACGLPIYSDAIRIVSTKEADAFFYAQCIAGDSTDGYGGAPGWGMVKAQRVLAEGKVLAPREHTVVSGPRKGEKEIRWEPGEEGTPWEIIVSVYQSVGLGEDMALATARVARILRVSDYHFTKKEPRLWTPS